MARAFVNLVRLVDSHSVEEAQLNGLVSYWGPEFGDKRFEEFEVGFIVRFDDTIARIRSIMGDAILADAAARGFLLVRSDILLPDLQKA